MRINAREHKRDGNQPLEEIPIWARRYAQSRTLPLLVSLGIFVAGGAMFAGLGRLVAWAQAEGQNALAGAAMVGLAAFATWWLWFSFFGAGPMMERIAERLYRREGSVSLEAREEGRPAGPSRLAAFFFLFCIAASIGLGILGLLPERYMQPISAVYCVPFLVYLWVKQRATMSPLALLWPALYGLHAILLVAGAPIRFVGSLEGMNIFVPVIGYGVIAALAGHIYSRFALRRLRRLTRNPGPGTATEEVES